MLLTISAPSTLRLHDVVLIFTSTSALGTGDVSNAVPNRGLPTEKRQARPPRKEDCGKQGPFLKVLSEALQSLPESNIDVDEQFN